MSAIVVTGYASLDYAVRLDRAPVADTTATISSRASEWPRLGGSPAYVARALVAAGVRDATPISWVGDDEDGRRYRAGLTGQGVDVAGVAARPGRTPVCILAYQPDGGCHCFYDPGLDAPPDLDDRQRALVSTAGWVCLAVGPPQATFAALEATRDDARLVWAVKADRRAVPPDLAAAIAARADVIAASRGEAEFVADALGVAGTSARRRWRLETRGAEGVALTRDGHTDVFPVEPLAVRDATGAGDTFLGGFLSALIGGVEQPEAAVAAGARAAREMLVGREGEGHRAS
jgi:ribokinase